LTNEPYLSILTYLEEKSKHFFNIFLIFVRRALGRRIWGGGLGEIWGIGGLGGEVGGFGGEFGEFGGGFRREFSGACIMDLVINRFIMR